jgi:hypothetical protein
MLASAKFHGFFTRARTAADECTNFALARAAAQDELAAGLHAAASNVRTSGVPRHAVAIPVRNEVHRVVACIDALAAQRDPAGQPFPFGHVQVVLLFNNCSDAGYALVRSQLACWPIAISIYDMTLPAGSCHAGHARRLANHAALSGLPADGALFMTDADSRVPPDWIARYAALLDGGCDAVAGLAQLSPDDHGDLPVSLMHRSAMEDRYANLLDELESLIDPLAHDPWPRHYSASGANMAVRADVMRTLDDFPDVPCGEDRRLNAMLERADRRVRHDTRTSVFTSGRLFGRAPGGKAETLRHRVLVPESACDERLERAETACRRATLRAMLRRLREQVDSPRAATAALAAEAGLPSDTVRQLRAGSRFGEAWNLLEILAAGLRRTSIVPSRLPAEICRCEEMIDAIRRGGDPVVASARELSA